MAHTDEQLVANLVQGDTSALDELYERYARKLFVFCDHTLGRKDSNQAEDVVQDVFIRVIKAANTFNPQKASFRTWLYRIARNRCIDLQRRVGRFAFLRLDGSLHLEETLPGQADPVECQTEENALQQAIRDCIQALENPEERQAILLYYLAGKVYREIAEILGKSLSTAKNRVQSAQDKVKDCLSVIGFP